MKTGQGLLAGLFVLVAACGEQPGAPSSPPPDPASLTPKDPALAKLYAQTCKSCHSTPGSGAPQTGDRAAWDQRFDQGMATLVDRTINGYKGMPPLGACVDCSHEDFEALIKFMAARQ